MSYWVRNNTVDALRYLSEQNSGTWDIYSYKENTDVLDQLKKDFQERVASQDPIQSLPSRVDIRLKQFKQGRILRRKMRSDLKASIRRLKKSNPKGNAPKIYERKALLAQSLPPVYKIIFFTLLAAVAISLSLVLLGAFLPATLPAAYQGTFILSKALTMLLHGLIIAYNFLSTLISMTSLSQAGGVLLASSLVSLLSLNYLIKPGVFKDFFTWYRPDVRINQQRSFDDVVSKIFPLYKAGQTIKKNDRSGVYQHPYWQALKDNELRKKVLKNALGLDTWLLKGIELIQEAFKRYWESYGEQGQATLPSPRVLKSFTNFCAETLTLVVRPFRAIGIIPYLIVVSGSSIVNFVINIINDNSETIGLNRDHDDDFGSDVKLDGKSTYATTVSRQRLLDHVAGKKVLPRPPSPSTQRADHKQQAAKQNAERAELFDGARKRHTAAKSETGNGAGERGSFTNPFRK